MVHHVNHAGRVLARFIKTASTTLSASRLAQRADTSDKGPLYSLCCIFAYKEEDAQMAVTAPPRGSRVSRRREPSEDAIEDEGPSQAANLDDMQDIAEFDDEEHVKPSRATKSSKGAKKEKKPGKARGGDASADNMEIDTQLLQDLGDQPIDRTQAAKVSGMSEDWARMRSTIHSNSYTLIRDVAATVAEFTDEDQGSNVSTAVLCPVAVVYAAIYQYLAHLESTVRSLVDTENELRAHEQALNELHQKIVRGEQLASYSNPQPIAVSFIHILNCLSRTSFLCTKMASCNRSMSTRRRHPVRSMRKTRSM